MRYHRRTWLKWLHWSMLPLVLWFTFVQPDDIRPLGEEAFMFHSVLGLIFVSLALLWTADYMRRGLAGRPGPKLRGRLRTLHSLMHRTLIWGLFLVAFTGFLLGLTSTVLLWAGGIVPIAPPMGLPRANDLVGVVHAIEFYTLAALVAGHALFHLWRHFGLNDNALRIMVPRALHRFL
ncbi:cytochrome b/b6 domain-containing protein [Roseobacter ponti]|uniref:Cytochrome B n=1 Tax=Roseobacter ponti TaxID=1891787 RepID=A0A858SRH0_9RHOB|nr:cytochrome b/b6 domain-containing protein [Roseobacter ponti]QJF50432.1 cytochrome B [Roseobacter ponti]